MKYLLVAALAWLLAQSTKRLLNLLGYNKRVFRDGESALFLSGGMPSGHSATVVALSMSIGLMEGFDTTVFAISGIFAVIVMYDAIKVRYSSGVQGDTINSLIKEQKSRIAKVRVAHGHTPLEVVAGALVGAVVASVVFFATTF